LGALFGRDYFMASAARRILRHNAIVRSTLFLPAAMTTLSFAVAWRSPTQQDGPGMLAALAVMLSILALPVTFAASPGYPWIDRRRR